MKRKISLLTVQVFLLVALILVGCEGIKCTPVVVSKILSTFQKGSGYYYYNSPTIVDGYIYIGTSRKLYDYPASDNYFFKLDTELNEVWAYSLGSVEVRGSATLDSNGNIYFVAENNRVLGNASVVHDFLYSLDSQGNFRWAREITAENGYHDMGMYNPAVSVNGEVYCGGGRLFAFDTSGNELWTFIEEGAVDTDIKNAPIIDENGNIYFVGKGLGKVKVYSLDSNGERRWIFETAYSEEYYSSPAFSVSQDKVIAAINQTIYCIKSNTGELLWEYKPSGIVGAFRGTPAVDEHNNVFVGTKANGNSVLYAINSDGQSILWQIAIGADLYSSPALGDGRILYIGSERTGDGERFHAIEMDTGEKLWSLVLEGDITWSSPALVNKKVFVGSMDGHVYSILVSSERLLPGAGSPRFHGGNESTGR